MPLNSPAEHIPGFEYRETTEQHESGYIPAPRSSRPFVSPNNPRSFASRVRVVRSVLWKIRKPGIRKVIWVPDVLDATKLNVPPILVALSLIPRSPKCP